MFLKKLRDGLGKTRERIQESFLSTGIFRTKSFNESIPVFEEILLSSDVGITATNEIIKRLRESRMDYKTEEDTIHFISKILTNILDAVEEKKGDTSPPYTILSVGVNGTGKTTTLVKLANHFKNKGENVLLVASDTYRPAGVEQLSIWGKMIGVDVLKSQKGQDPAAVAFDAIESAFSKNYSVVLIDTAGRLHTKKNLMEELKKVKNVLNKKRRDLPHDIFLVLDATTGQNALSQAEIFKDSLDVTGVILTKIDGTAKGGIIFAISLEVGIPVRYIGTGENVEDLIEFDPKIFVASLFEGENVT